MPSVTFGITNKRANSIKSTMTNSITLNCLLKEPCSRRQPVFSVTGLSKTTLYNYLSWNDRYYYIEDITYITNDICEVYATIDPLATFKDSIKNTYGYCLYGDSAHKTPYVDDIRFGPDIKIQRESGVGIGAFDLGFSIDHWSVVLTVQSTNGSASYSSVLTVAMPISTFYSVCKNLSGVVLADVSSWSTTDLLDIIKNYCIRVLTGGIQALDNIRSAVVVPIPYSEFESIGNVSTTFWCGPYDIWLDSGKTVVYFDPSKTKIGNGVVSLARPIANTTYKWLNSPKYCSIKVTHPCGYQEINDNSLLDLSNIYIYWSVNLATGEYAIRITSEASKDSDTIALINGSTGVDIMNAVQASGNTMDSNLHNVVDSMLNVSKLGGIFNAGSSMPSGSGTQLASGCAGLFLLTSGKECFVDTEYYQPSIFNESNGATEYNDFCTEYGYPVNRYLKVGDITGFAQFSNANVKDISGATLEDKDYINSILNSGIYIE